MNTRKLPTLAEDSYPIGKGQPILKRIGSGIQDALGGIKNQSSHLTNTVISGAKKRPGVFLGLALASGFLIGKAIRRKYY